MTMTSERLRKALRHVENQIAGLEAANLSHYNEEYLSALRSLRHRRAWIRGLLAVRRLERSSKIVNLELWRSGFDLTAAAQQGTGIAAASASASPGAMLPF